MTEYVLPVDQHNAIVQAAYQKRGYTVDESLQASRFCELAAWHGIKTHNALKALHLDDFIGSGNKQAPGCVPGAAVVKKPSKFDAAAKWIANKKLGQAVAFDAIETAMSLADRYGVGIVSVDQAFHYLWGGGYVMEAAKKGYVAYTNCTSSLAEVVPFGGKFPTLGTNPHSWGFPTVEAIGFPIVIDWATSVIAMGKVQQLEREGQQLPPGAAVDANGDPTSDPTKVAALLPFGQHKGYGLSLINELVAALIGGSLPTIRSIAQHEDPDEKTTTSFFFQVIHRDALNCNVFAKKRNQTENLKAVIDDVLGHGNSPPRGRCILPGQIEHEAAMRSNHAGGLIFTEAEIKEFDQISREAGVVLDAGSLQTVNA